MGYVEDIKKINIMAKELISHGMAKTFDEAVQKATKMLSEGGDVTHSRDFEASKQAQQPQQQPQDSARDERTGMTWQQAMAKNNEYIVKMLKDFQKQVEEHHSKVTLLESSMRELVKRQAKLGEMLVTKGSEEINIEDDENNQQQSQRQEPPRQQPRQEQRESHPKQGNYNPDDVSVEKMFYFGKK